MIRKILGLGAVVSLVALSLGGLQGCGSDDKVEGDPIPTAKYPDFAAFCNAIANAQCTQAIQTACSLSNVSDQQCEGEASRACSTKDSEITRAVKNTSNYRKDKAEACVDAVTVAYSKATIAAADHVGIRTACDPVFRGKNTAGFECDNDLDCDDGLGCYFADLASAKGTCEKTSIKAKGDDCSIKGDVCGAGLYCSPTDKGCLARPAKGGECSATKPCQEAFACTNIDAMTGKGTCSDKKINKDPCEQDTECQSGFCALVGSSKQCYDSLTFGTGSPICDNFDGK